MELSRAWRGYFDALTDRVIEAGHGREGQRSEERGNGRSAVARRLTIRGRSLFRAPFAWSEAGGKEDSKGANHIGKAIKAINSNSASIALIGNYESTNGPLMEQVIHAHSQLGQL